MSALFQEYRLALRTVTPLFMAGAEARGAPELRPPALRGAMRYWLRAAAGGVYGDDDNGLLRVREIEGRTFGSTDETKASASAVTVRVSTQSAANPMEFCKQATIRTIKNGKSIQQPTGRDYLYWSMAKSGRAQTENYQGPKQYWPDGMTFDLLLQKRPGALRDEQALLWATAAAWLLIQFGGVGSRSRRTAGSLSSARPQEINGLKFASTATSCIQLADELAQGLKSVRSMFATTSTIPSVSDPSSFDVLHARSCRVWVLGIWADSSTAVESVGAALRDFRSYREPDHANVARWFGGNAIPTVERAAFGLPIPFHYSDGGPSGAVQGRLRNPTIDRRASPLWLKITRTQDGRYAGVATLFKSAFLPAGEKLYAKTRGASPPPANPPTDYSLIETWVASEFPNASEVSL